MLSLPPTDHPAREFLSVAQLVECTATPESRRRLPGLQQAARQAREAFAHSAAHKGGLQAIHSLVCFADGTLRLVRFGPNGGKRILWTFGQF